MENDNEFIEMTGVIQGDGSVTCEDRKIRYLPFRGTDGEGYPEVLMDAKSVGGDSWMHRQSVKPFIGMTVQFGFNRSEGKDYLPFNFEIISISSEIKNRENILALRNGERYVVPSGDTGKAEIWFINNFYFLFDISYGGGEPQYVDFYTKWKIDDIIKEYNLWT